MLNDVKDCKNTKVGSIVRGVGLKTKNSDVLASKLSGLCVWCCLCVCLHVCVCVPVCQHS